ncbi:GerW family sporulation protein [Thermoactinomyces mirandus]|uniref:GerW family sporulation protein n=1 Tax=Thermoactinomyces mirandus TaxID=2756294 RepID=A0A7W2ATK1_9BACL|nr:GerW family sporulation protein [Thermoactinomyces mirandus]MBA4603845.1 GerW family sporulation protein [Thermoactinomyces mirandus]
MSEHPIQNLMKTAMENIREMIDVNTIIGDPVETQDGQVIIPVSKVGFGFAAGGSEFKADHEERNRRESDHQGKGNREEPGKDNRGDGNLPFGGGSGGGVSVTPVAFLVVDAKGIRILNMDGQTHLFDRLIDAVPEFVEQLKNMVTKNDKDKRNGCN